MPSIAEELTKRLTQHPEVQSHLDPKTRSLLLEEVLPATVSALEKLLLQIERQSEGGGSENAKNFDPINVLAQTLYRDNPRFQSRKGEPPAATQQIGALSRLRELTPRSSSSSLAFIPESRSRSSDLALNVIAEGRAGFRARPTRGPFSERVETTSMNGLDRAGVGSHHDLSERLQLLQSLYEELCDSQAKSDLSCKIYNQIVEQTLSMVSSSDLASDKDTLKSLVALVKFPVSSRMILTKRITFDEFKDLFNTQLDKKSVKQEHFAKVIELISQEAKLFDQGKKIGRKLTESEYSRAQLNLLKYMDEVSTKPDVSLTSLGQQVAIKMSQELAAEFPVLGICLALVENETTLHFVACTPKDEPFVQDKRLDISQLPVSFAALQSKQSQIIPDVRQSEDKVMVFGDEHTGTSLDLRNGSLVIVPLVLNGTSIGVLSIDSIRLLGPGQKVQPFKQRDIQFFEVG